MKFWPGIPAIAIYAMLSWLHSAHSLGWQVVDACSTSRGERWRSNMQSAASNAGLPSQPAANSRDRLSASMLDRLCGHTAIATCCGIARVYRRYPTRAAQAPRAAWSTAPGLDPKAGRCYCLPDGTRAVACLHARPHFPGPAWPLQSLSKASRAGVGCRALATIT